MHSPYSCLDIAAHIDNCPICSKFYKNDKTVFYCFYCSFNNCVYHFIKKSIRKINSKIFYNILEFLYNYILFKDFYI